MNKELELVHTMERELYRMISSVKSTVTGLLGSYTLIAADYVRAAAKGYAVLRDSHENLAAKLLMRPIIETSIKLKAANQGPVNFYRIAVGEFRSDGKWMEGLNSVGCETDGAADIFKQRRDDFHAAFVKEFPAEILTENDEIGLGTECLFKRAQLHPYYQTHYRLYCRLSHGDLSAMTGQFDAVDLREDLSVAMTLLNMMHFVEALGAVPPDYESYTILTEAFKESAARG